MSSQVLPRVSFETEAVGTVRRPGGCFEERTSVVNAIFVFGAERSGTTFLGSLLGSHSEAVATPEAQFVTHVYRDVVTPDGAVDLSDAFTKIGDHFRFKLWGLETSLPALGVYGVRSYADLVLALVSEYAQTAGRPGARLWVDHTPGNLRTAALLRELFPEARFVHIVRDGRAVVASVRALDWGTHSARALTRDWVLRVGYGLAAESYLTPGRCLRVRYEDLLTAPEATLRRVCDFAGLTFEPAMLGGGGFAVPAYTQQQHRLVGAPPDAGRINGWVKTLSPRDVETCEFVSGDMLTYLGYEPVFGSRARLESRAERYRAILTDLLWYRWVDRFRRKRKRRRGLEKRNVEPSQGS